MSKNLELALEILVETNGVKEISSLINALEGAGEEIAALKKKAAAISKSWDELSEAEQELAKKELIERYKELSQSQEELIARAQRLKTAQEKAAQAAEQASKAQESAAQSVAKGKNAQEEAAAATKKAAAATEQQTAALESQRGVLERARSSLSRYIAGFTGLFAAMKSASFLSGSVGIAAGLEEQLSKVQAVSGASVEEMAKISEMAQKLGESTRYSAAEAAAGFEILARAGLNAQQSLTAIPQVLQLAQAAGLPLAEAASYITKAVAGMNLSISDSGRVADVLAKAAASANTDVSGLGQALSYAAPSAAALGLSLEQTVAMIGKFSDAGIDASRAGTALNSILAQFGNETSSFRKALSDIGITTNNFREALAELAKSGDAGKAAINAVGQEAGPALKALLAQGIPALEELEEKLKNSAGASKEMAETMDNNLIGAWRGLKSAFESLRNDLAAPLLEPLKEGVKGLAQSMRELVASGAVKEWGEGLKIAFNALSTGVSTLVKFGKELIIFGASLKATTLLVKAKTAALGLWTSAAASSSKATAAMGVAVAATNGALKLFMRTAAGFAGLAIFGAVKTLSYLFEKLKSRSKEAGEAVRESIEGLNESAENLNKLKTALESSSSLTDKQIEASREQAQAAKEASNQRVAAIYKELNALEDSWRAQSSAQKMLLEQLAAERKHQAELNATARAIENRAQAEQAAARASEEAFKAQEAQAQGWEKLGQSIDEATKKQMQFPERTQAMLDGITQIVAASRDMGEELLRAFDIAGSQVDSHEAIEALLAQVNKAHEAGLLTAQEMDKAYAMLGQKTAFLLPTASEAAVAIQKLGIDSRELYTGISTQGAQALELFRTAAQGLGGDVEKLAVVYNAALAKLTNDKEIQALEQELALLSDGENNLANSIKNRALEQKNANIASQEEEKALQRLGISLEALDKAMSKSGLETAQSFELAIKAIQNTVKESSKAALGINQAFEAAAKGAKTKADFEALNNTLKQTGAAALLSAENIALLEAGLGNSSQAVSSYGQSVQDAAAGNAALGGSVVQLAEDFASLCKSAGKAQEATDSLAASQEQLGSTGAQSAQRIEFSWNRLTRYLTDSAEAINAQSASIDAVRKAWEQVAESLSFVNNDIGGFERKLEVLTNQYSSFNLAVAAAEERIAGVIQKLQGASVSSEDLAEATALLGQNMIKVGDFSAELDGLQFENLRAAIEAARKQMQGLAQDAKDSADALEAELAALKGNTKAKAEYEQTKKLKDLEEKLRAARERGNAEEVLQYNRIIALQKEYYAEQERQEAKKAREEKQKAENTSSVTTAQSSQNSQISAKEVAGAFAKQIAEAAEQAKKAAKIEFARELIEEAKKKRR